MSTVRLTCVLNILIRGPSVRLTCVLNILIRGPTVRLTCVLNILIRGPTVRLTCVYNIMIRGPTVRLTCVFIAWLAVLDGVWADEVGCASWRDFIIFTNSLPSASSWEPSILLGEACEATGGIYRISIRGCTYLVNNCL